MMIAECIPLLLATLCHEMGHLLACRCFRVPLRGFHAAPFSLLIRYDPSRISYPREAMIALAGPLVGCLSALIAMCFPPLWLRDRFMLYSLSLSVFNLLPIRHLDGGVLLSAMLRGCIGLERSERILSVFSSVCTVLLWMCAIAVQLRSGGNLSLLLLSVLLLLELRRS